MSLFASILDGFVGYVLLAAVFVAVCYPAGSHFLNLGFYTKVKS